MLLKNCALLRTDTVNRQISEHFFMPNGGYGLYFLQVVQYFNVLFELGKIQRKSKIEQLFYSSH